MPTPVSASMMEEEEANKSWFARFWGVLFMILLVGSIVGLPLWWVWAKSPLQLWVKCFLTAILVGLIIFLI